MAGPPGNETSELPGLVHRPYTSMAVPVDITATPGGSPAMAKGIERQVLHDSSTDLVLKVTIRGNGSGDESDQVLVDAASVAPRREALRIRGVHGRLSGFSVTLSWEAERSVDVLELPADEDFNLDISEGGGLPNVAGAGRTGNLLMSTFDLSDGDTGAFVLWLRKGIRRTS